MFALTVPYIVQLLKVHCYYVSLGKLRMQKKRVDCSSIALFKR